MSSVLLKLVGAASWIGIGAAGVYWFVPLSLPAPLTNVAVGAHLVGKSLPSLEVLNEGSATGSAPLPIQGGELVVLFRPGCGICSLVAPTWKEISDSVDGGNRILAITVGALPQGRDWLNKQKLSEGRLFQEAHAGALQSGWGLAGTPLTIVVGADRQVQFAKYGLLADADVQRIVSLLAGSGAG